MKKNIKNQIKEKDLDKVNGGTRKIDPILKPGLPKPIKEIGKNELPLSPASNEDDDK